MTESSKNLRTGQKLNRSQVSIIIATILLEIGVFSLPPTNGPHWHLVSFLNALDPPQDQYSPSVFNVLLVMALSGIVCLTGLFVAIGLSRRPREDTVTEENADIDEIAR